LDFLRRRIVIYVVVFFVVLNLDFILPRLVPGNAAQILASGSKIPANDVILLEKRFGLNEPVYIQYYLFLKGIFATWPPFFGVSYSYYPDTVLNLFLTRVVWTLFLVITSLMLSLFLAYVVAGIGSLRRGSKFEIGALYASILMNSTPIFWIGMGLLWLFSVILGWFPLSGNVDFSPGGGLSYYGSVIWHAILPILALSTTIFGEFYLLLRGSTQQVLKDDYVLAAKSRGLRNRVISSTYILRNSLLPIVSILSFSLASLISRVVLVEAVFGYPGIGDLIVDAVGGRDYPVLEGSLLLLTVLVLVGGFLGDLLLIRLDPRLRR
jgi:peptide/nickel transport system permease protein